MAIFAAVIQMVQRIVLSDIFGYTEALNELVEQLPGASCILNPYQPAGELSVAQRFADEAEAYAAFTRSGGVCAYSEKLRGVLEQLNEPVELLGFSAGAAAIWYAGLDWTEVDSEMPVRRATGFYASQIRHRLNAAPRFPLRLILPVSEAHFSVAELAAALAGFPQVELMQSDYQHGFMNPLSVNYSAEAYRKYLHFLQTA